MMAMRTLEIELYLCGIEIAESYQNDSLSIEQIPIEYRGQRFSNCLHVRQCVLVPPDSNIPEQDYINRVLLDEVNLFLQSLSLLLIDPFWLVTDKTKLDGVEVKLDLPARGAPLGLYNMATWWNRGTDKRGYSCKVHNDGWPILEKLMYQFHLQPEAVKKQFAVPLRWFAKGSDELSSLGRLVAFWIAFNALYRGHGRTELAAIENYLQDTMNTTVAEHYVAANAKILGKLAGLPIELGRGYKKRQIAHELMGLLNSDSINHLEIVKIATLTIYGIRNSLFHGDYDPIDEEMEKHFQMAENLLSRLLKELIAKLMLGYPLPPTRFVIQRKFTAYGNLGQPNSQLVYGTP